MTHWLKRTVYCSASIGMGVSGIMAQDQGNEQAPNVIYIMADDLGIGDLGCYGQRFIKTPAIDKLAANGIRFAQHYSGSTVSAPSRCSLMTGKHTGHSFIRGNKGVVSEEGDSFDYPLAANEITVGEIMKRKHYVTACIGKWGMGGPHTEGHPNSQGFDYFFGYLGQANAHRYYPRFLFENQTKVNLNKQVYSHDLIMGKVLDFIRENAGKPFFLYLTPTIPHADLIVPDDELGEYDGMFDEKPFPQGGYTAQPKPRATFAAMVSRLDRGVQQIMNLLESKGIAENTIVIFTSDNGTHIEGGHNPFAFNSSGGFRGHKRDLYEGGIRTPFIVSWPKKISKGLVSYHVSAFWDFLPTMCDLIGEQVPLGVDGLSYLPELTKSGEQKKHDYLYWEFHEEGGKQAVIKDNWKLITFNVNNPGKAYMELYNLNADPSEQLNAVTQYPEKVRELKTHIESAHSRSPLFPFKSEM
ncbi:arylsulfatase A-like enzyme [Parabacteroides sp. PF5-5]|uniref:arylsulfatase n=1 Tax=unclassified Parabacteroides TaxID=2649774 RepID=UPI002474C22B|nr:MULTISPECIES: arylsulfatase [unclassified Parabacteroides]MDH6304189.1 arylsulfatase A-like enzyme [Parabacteroides sp. PH5-39]MDH6315095.1 arylsulfatase A-like enzyme [Parabacteroides sp. PF5-13]MDH6318756.1 arylsulfatase A-like enzyme [Parabacteroides sp. PH5-13]MDH6322485.1 arylsulfatase A-like enzyme [Parabacteroides sp. PH5-8]MDH6326379.1 arylsulfatase A-like enzyme [Parabacteroides sp. PH5-41]